MENKVLEFFWPSDKREFNLYHNELYSMSNTDWNTIPCIVFLNNDTFLWLDKLVHLQNHKHLTSIYKIISISFLHPETYVRYTSGMTTTTQRNVFKDGLYLLPKHYLFKTHVEPLL